MEVNNKLNLEDAISLFVYDEISVLDEYEPTYCSFTVVDGIAIGYQYSGADGAEEALNRMFDILFEETDKRLEAKKAEKHPLDS